jgi:hypothetical protein
MGMIRRFAQWVVKSAGPTDAAGYFYSTGGDLAGNPEKLTEPYRRSAWVRAAIDKISGPVASVAVDFYPCGSSYFGMPKSEGRNPKAERRPKSEGRRPKKKSYRTGRGVRALDQEQELELPVMMEFLRAPMQGLGYSDFVEATQGWLRMAGECFWLLPDDARAVPFPDVAAGVGRTPQVIVARPDRMRHVVDGGELLGWEFTDGKGRRFLLLPSQVIQLKQWNPYDQWRGLGQFEAAALAAESDWLAGRFARNLMANNGDTGPYLIAKNGIPTDEQRKQILADLREKRMAQLRGQFRPMFLTGDISVEDPQVRSVDAAYVAGRIENRHEIFIALGVPPSMADVKAAYSIGSASDFYQLILNTCVPAGDKYCDGLGQLVKLWTGQAVEAFLDWDEHPVFQEVRKERLASVDTLWGKGMPLCEISDYLGLGLPRFEGDEMGYLPFSVSPVDGNNASQGNNEPANNPDLAEPEADANVMEALRALAGAKSGMANGTLQMAEGAGSECCCGCSIEERDLVVRDRDPKEVAHWKESVSKRLPIIKAYRSKFDAALMKARREVLAKIEAKKAVQGKAAAADFMFNILGFTQEFHTSMRGVSLQAVMDAGNQLFKEVGKDDPFKSPAAATMHFMESRENKLSGVPDEVFGRVRDSIQEQIDRGGTMTDIERAVKAEFNSISDGRGKVIAQTETAAAFGFGRHKAMEDADIKWKRWLCSGNSNVRAAHKALNGAIVAIDEKFTAYDPKSGETDQVMHPADEGGAPWNVINCHCVAVSSASGPASEDGT